MKLIVTLLLIITRLSFQKSHDELDRLEEKVDEITEKCMEKQKLHNLSDYFSSEETDLENLQCFIKCRQEAVGMISSEVTPKRKKRNSSAKCLKQLQKGDSTSLLRDMEEPGCSKAQEKKGTKSSRPNKCSKMDVNWECGICGESFNNDVKHKNEAQ
ncbi:hypothetical protein RN001_002120 [Aquatica leii]|uniref:Uncharacterized protein n=1 Tax=Aquatica leii TaxID=1421715 RepID=A0AAN7PGN0_9COLE|nr:hypothetical protein RN001_002120 [Aquatica leii]